MYLRYYNNEKTTSNRAPIDIVEMDDSYLVFVNLPGFTKDEVEVEADFETLSIVAKHKVEDKKDEKDTKKYLLRERRTGEFSRFVTFSKPINAAEGNVTLKNGVLSIKLPLADNARKIKLMGKTEEKKLLEEEIKN